MQAVENLIRRLIWSTFHKKEGFIVPRRYFFCKSFLLFMSCVCHAFASVHCGHVATCWERAGLLALVCDVYMRFCHVSMWYPGSGVALDCIDS